MRIRIDLRYPIIGSQIEVHARLFGQHHEMRLECNWLDGSTVMQLVPQAGVAIQIVSPTDRTTQHIQQESPYTALCLECNQDEFAPEVLEQLATLAKAFRDHFNGSPLQQAWPH